MKLFIAVLLSLLAAPILAQCDYDATIEGDILLCPDAQGQLSTQEFDAYQWLRRAYNESTASPIAGATNQSLDIDAFNDALYYFSVEITHENCTEISEEVLVDGWVFLPVTVISQGDFDIGSNGEAIICEGDSMFFELGAPYNKNITWFKDGMAIPDETSTKLTVKEEGYYTASAAPSECPDYISYLGVEIYVVTISCNTNVDPVKDDIEVRFYPNPTTEYAKVESVEQVDSYFVMSSDGKVLLNQNINKKRFDLNLSFLLPGSYLLQLNSGSNLKTVKFIVQ